MKLNNKGMSIIEIVISFTLVMLMITGMLTIVVNYRNKAAISIEKLEMNTFKNTLTQDIQNDILTLGIKEINSDGECPTLSSLDSCINLVFKDNSEKAFGISKINANDRESIEKKFLYYDGLKYELYEVLPEVIPTGRNMVDLQAIVVENKNILTTDSAVLEDGTNIVIYSIDVYISHIDFQEDFGIHIVATTNDADINLMDTPNIDLVLNKYNATTKKLPYLTANFYDNGEIKYKDGSYTIYTLNNEQKNIILSNKTTNNKIDISTLYGYEEIIKKGYAILEITANSVNGGSKTVEYIIYLTYYPTKSIDNIYYTNSEINTFPTYAKENNLVKLDCRDNVLGIGKANCNIEENIKSYAQLIYDDTTVEKNIFEAQNYKGDNLYTKTIPSSSTHVNMHMIVTGYKK